MANDRLVVFVHGWSVRNTSTYGEFPARLAAEARREAGLEIDTRHIWLSKYVSFDDEVRMEDVSRAFEAAVRRELGAEVDAGRRFAAITHSTGGPVVRDWWDRFYVQQGRPRACPLSHLIMLAPANFGSALAQLGKSRLSRVRAWFQGVEPGQKMLDWLELGSPEAWELNRRWFDYDGITSGRNAIFPFVLTGQCIDHKLYDHVNSYTGEPGSDGVVRAAAANLNATWVELVQNPPRPRGGSRSRPQYEAPELKVKSKKRSPRTAFRLVERRAHSGTRIGVITSVRDDGKPHPTVSAVLDCLRVRTGTEYARLCDRFEQETAVIEQQERLEKQVISVLPDRWWIHDPFSMVIVRVEDDRGHGIGRFDLLLTAGPKDSPDALPKGFFQDRQGNQRRHGMLTYFLNHTILHGATEIREPGGKVLREAAPGAGSLGLRIRPFDTQGLIHYAEAGLRATTRQLSDFVRPHETTLVHVRMRRIVREGVFRLTRERKHASFHRDPEGPAID